MIQIHNKSKQIFLMNLEKKNNHSALHIQTHLGNLWNQERKKFC